MNLKIEKIIIYNRISDKHYNFNINHVETILFVCNFNFFV